MAVLIDSENMGMSMEKWEDEGNGIVRGDLAPAWGLGAVVFGGYVYLYLMTIHDTRGSRCRVDVTSQPTIAIFGKSETFLSSSKCHT